jgi:siroheme synthase-like protein
MRTHPVFLRLDGRRCVVVGGDDAARAKVEACLAAGASVRVIAAAPHTALRDLAAQGRIELCARPYADGDLEGALVAYASERNPATVARLREEADRARVLLNVLDVPDACSFFSPAVVARGDLQVAIGTGGASPGLAARLRRELETAIGPEYEPYVAILGAVRRRFAGEAGRAQAIERLVESDLLALVRRGEAPAVDALLRTVGGEDCTLDGLGIALAGRA